MAVVADYPNNSDKAKMVGAKAEVTPTSKIRPVDMEDDQPQKINWFREFILGSPKDAKNTVIRDVLFPSIKRTAVDAVQAFLTFLFDGGVRTTSRGRDYSSISRSGSVSRSATFTKDAPEDTGVGSIFVQYGSETKGPMEVARETLIDLCDRQGYVTVRDYYDVLGKSSTNISYDNHYGWTNLSMTEVRYRVFDGRYYIEHLPRPKLLDID